MKRKSCLTLALILIMAQVISLFAVLPVMAEEGETVTPSKNYNFIKIPETVEMTIDGKGNEAVWANAGWSEKFVKVHAGDGNEPESPVDAEVQANLSMRFKAVWQPVGADRMKVYILVATGATTSNKSGSYANGLRIRIDNMDSSKKFLTYYKNLTAIAGKVNETYTTSAEGVTGGFDPNYKLGAVNDIANSGVAMYEFSYEMEKVDSFKFDVLPAICSTDGKWYCASWAGATLESNNEKNYTAKNGASGIATISDSEIDGSLPSINIVKATQAVQIDGTVDATWANAEWSNQFERQDCTYTGTPKNVYMKAMWHPVADTDKINVYVLVVAPTTNNWGNGNFIQIQMANAAGCFYTPMMKKGAMSATTGTAIGLENTSFQMACADNTVGGSKMACYEFSYQMDKADVVDGIRLDAVVRGEPANYKYTNYCWAGAPTLRNDAPFTATTVLCTPSGIGMLLDEANSGPSMDIIKTTQNIVVDGIADDVWAFANSSENFQHVVGETLDGFSVNYKALWSPVGEDKMNVYIFITATGYTQASYRNNIRIQIQDGAKRFWSGMKQLGQTATATSVDYNGGGEGGAATAFKLAAVDNLNTSGSATYEFCYTMDRSDFIKFDILADARKSSKEDVDCIYSWAGMTVDTASIGANGFGNIIDTTPAELLENLNFVVDEETQGASVYLNTENSDLSGIRFATTINVDAFNGLMAQGAEITTGTLVTYTETLTTLGIADKDFNLDTLKANGLEEDVHFYDIVNEDNGWVNGKPGTWFATIYDIQDFDRSFSAVGYITIKLGDVTTTIYETYNETNDARSIAYVAETLMAKERDNGHIGLDEQNQERGMFTTAQEAILQGFYNTEA